MSWWHVGAAANLVILAAYLGIAYSIIRNLVPEQLWKRNPLAVATAAIFFTCAVHHGSHPVHQLLPYIGIEEHVGLAMRAAFDDWHVSSWDIVTAAVGVWYWTLRGRFPALVHSSALFEDVIARERQALDIHDNIVQGLATAKLAFELDDRERGMSALEQSLAASRKIISQLMGDGHDRLPAPGDLRRRDAAGGESG